MKYLYSCLKVIIIVALINSSHESLATTVIFQDTSLPQKPHQLSQQQFLDKYGHDDTSRAMILLFFKTNKSAKKLVFLSAAVGILSYLAADAIFKSTDNVGGIEFLGILIVVATLAIPFNIFYWIRYSRQNLLKHLERHKAGNRIPKWIRRDELFQKFLKKE